MYVDQIIAMEANCTKVFLLVVLAKRERLDLVYLLMHELTNKCILLSKKRAID